MVYEEGWQGMHVVALGIGRYGEEEGEGYAWQVQRFVRSVGFGVETTDTSHRIAPAGECGVWGG